MVLLVLSIRVHPWWLRSPRATASAKKADVVKRPRHSTTSAYSSTDSPARPGRPSPSHPTTSNQAYLRAVSKLISAPSLASLYSTKLGKQVHSGLIVGIMVNDSPGGRGRHGWRLPADGEMRPVGGLHENAGGNRGGRLRRHD